MYIGDYSIAIDNHDPRGLDRPALERTVSPESHGCYNLVKSLELSLDET